MKDWHREIKDLSAPEKDRTEGVSEGGFSEGSAGTAVEAHLGSGGQQV